MAISSYGYDGSVSEGPWAQLFRAANPQPCVFDAASWNVTAVTGADRTVRVAAGSGAGVGIYDVVDAAVDIELPTVSGDPKWTTIVCRRDWTTPDPGGTTSFTYEGQYTQQAVASTLNKTPGTKYDTPLALVRVSAGVTVPDQVIDLRVRLDQVQSGWMDWKEWPGMSQHSSLSWPGASIGARPSYRISVDGDTVEFAGAIARSPALLDQAELGQLPAEACPGSSRTFLVAGNAASMGTLSGTVLRQYASRIEVQAGGKVILTNAYSPTYIVLDGIRYTRTVRSA